MMNEPSREGSNTPVRRGWIEKAALRGNDHAFPSGRYLWSPQRSHSGADIYRFMREVHPGDLVLHVVSDELIGSSLAALKVQEIDQFGRGYYIVKLDDFQRLAEPLRLHDVFARRESEYKAMAARRGAYLFFNSDLKLRQGAYLTPASPLFLQDAELCRRELVRNTKG